MGQRGIETFFPLYLADQVGLNTVWVGFYLSILTFSSTLPEPAMGWLSDQSWIYQKTRETKLSLHLHDGANQLFVDTG